MAAKRSVLGAIGFLLLSSYLGFAWSGLPEGGTHDVLTEMALVGMLIERGVREAEARAIARRIAQHADGPDFHREICRIMCPIPGLRRLHPACRFCPEKDKACQLDPKNTTCSDTHAHRITKFMHVDEVARYSKDPDKVTGNGGAEKGAAYWAQRARGAYLVYSRTPDPTDKEKLQQEWQRYLGWATHYLADALAPSSCYDPKDLEKLSFWREEPLLVQVLRVALEAKGLKGLPLQFLLNFFDTREDLFETGIQIVDWYYFKGVDSGCNAVAQVYEAVRRRGQDVGLSLPPWDERDKAICEEILRALPPKAWEWLRNYREWVEKPTSIVTDDFNAVDAAGIERWIKEKAEHVAKMLQLRKNQPPPSWPYLSQEDLKKVFAWISIGIRGLYRYVTGQRVAPVTYPTATVLVIDVSGSMAWQWRGGVKIESAKKAALQFVEQVANEPRQPGSSHMIGVVTFSDDASVVCPLTDDYNQAKNTIIRLGTLASTNLGAGLTVALRELDKLPSSAKRFIILLSDGVITSGLSPEQVLARPVAEARAKGICIHAVGFGDPGDIDEDFLKKVAQQSGCGTYHYAASGFELFGTYIKVRHAMLGSNKIVDFPPAPSPVRMLPGQTATLGAFQLTAPAQELHYTLAWSEPGRMSAILVDPSGRQVTTAYPNTTIYSGNGFMHITVFSPQPGTWRASAAANTSFLSGVQYYGVVSARTGGVVIPIPMPTVCFTVADQKICIPLPDMPTVLVVLIGVGVAIYLLYTHLLAP